MKLKTVEFKLDPDFMEDGKKVFYKALGESGLSGHYVRAEVAQGLLDLIFMINTTEFVVLEDFAKSRGWKGHEHQSLWDWAQRFKDSAIAAATESDA